MSTIRLLSRKQIDDVAWNATIDTSGKGLPYAYSWYLDIVTNHRWSALVEGDYEYVLPLPWNHKLLGLPQVYQPVFSQQYGIFGKEVSLSDTERFLVSIPNKFRRVNLMLHGHHTNSLPEIASGTYRWKMNLVLPLNRPFEDIQADFSKSLRKRSRKADRQLRLQEGGSVERLVNFYQKELQHKVGLSAKAYPIATRLFQALLERAMAEIYEVYDLEDRLVCTGLFIVTEQRIINLFGASNDRGRATYAMHYLLTKVIQKYAGQEMLFDFEGSEVPGVAQFFRSFGAVEQPFFAYQRDTLPLLLRQLLALR